MRRWDENYYETDRRVLKLLLKENLDKYMRLKWDFLKDLPIKMYAPRVMMKIYRTFPLIGKNIFFPFLRIKIVNIFSSTSSEFGAFSIILFIYLQR